MRIDMLNNFSHNQTTGSTALSDNSVFVAKMGDVDRTISVSFNEGAPTVPSGTTMKVQLLGSDTDDFVSTSGAFSTIMETKAFTGAEMTTGGFAANFHVQPHEYKYERLKYVVSGSDMSNVKLEANMVDGVQTNMVKK